MTSRAGQLFETPPPMTEKQLQDMVSRRLKDEGYRTQHIYRSRMPDGKWRTTTTAIGFPDLIALRGPYILAIELKGATGRLSPEQVPWLESFAELAGGRAWLLTPKDDRQFIANAIHDPATAPRVHGFASTRALVLPT